MTRVYDGWVWHSEALAAAAAATRASALGVCVRATRVNTVHLLGACTSHTNNNYAFYAHKRFTLGAGDEAFGLPNWQSTLWRALAKVMSLIINTPVSE